MLRSLSGRSEQGAGPAGKGRVWQGGTWPGSAEEQAQMGARVFARSERRNKADACRSAGAKAWSLRPIDSKDRRPVLYSPGAMEVQTWDRSKGAGLREDLSR